MAGIKIVDLPALGRDLAATDLLELSLAGGTGSRKITGQEIINASKLNVGTTPIINGTAGRLLFQSTGNVLSQSGNLFWDNTNGRLGIGTSTPLSALGIVQTDAIITVRNTNATAYSGMNMYDDANNLVGSFAIGGTNASVPALAGNMLIGARAATGRLLIVGGPSATTFATMFSTGNLAINTTTDAGFKLDVNGAARIKGTGTTSSTTALTVQNSAGTTYFSIKDDGALSSSGTDTGIYSNFTTGNKSPLLFSHSGYGTNTPNDTRIDFGYRGRQAGGLNSYDFFTYKVYQGADPTVTTGFEFYTHQNQASSLASQLAMAINGSNVGIGTSSPTQKLDVNGTARFKDTGSNSSVIIDYATGGYIRVNDASLGEAIRLRAGGGASWFNTGQNLLIGTTTDAGFRLDVNGTARFTGRIDAGSFTPGAGASAYTIATTGRISAGNGISFRSPIVGDSIFVGLSPASGHSQIEIYTSGNRGFVFGGSGGDTSPMANATANFNPSSGTGDKAIFQVSGQYQTSGTYSGAIRGFYYSPTLTSMTGVTAHWAIHTTSGRVRFEGLPTSPTGLNAGDLWNDAGTLKIV